MLILNRKIGERIMIGDGIVVSVQRISGNRVSLAIEAPGDVRILRAELNSFDDHDQEPTSFQTGTAPIQIPGPKLLNSEMSAVA